MSQFHLDEFENSLFFRIGITKVVYPSYLKRKTVIAESSSAMMYLMVSGSLCQAVRIFS